MPVKQTEVRLKYPVATALMPVGCCQGPEISLGKQFGDCAKRCCCQHAILRPTACRRFGHSSSDVEDTSGNILGLDLGQFS